MLVVSDLAGTLTTGSPVMGLVDWVRHHQSRPRAALYMARITPSYLLAKRGLVDWNRWTQGLMLSAMSLIRHADEQTIQRMAAWTVDQFLWPARRQDVIDRLLAQQAQGARVVITSSVYEPTAAAFAYRIGAEAIGTPVAVKRGRMVLDAEVAAGPEKAAQVMKQLGVSHVDFAYGDTRADIPLLNLARNPVAVYPDVALKAEAKARGWEIIGEREPL